MIENLVKLYRVYGGPTAFFRSAYLWTAVFLCFVTRDSLKNGAWAETVLDYMPSLSGFTIAAFAIVLAVFRPQEMRALSGSGDTASPLSRIAATVTHAVVVQLMAIVLAAASSSASLTAVSEFCVVQTCFENISSIEESLGQFFSVFGLFLGWYWLLLVLAAVLSLFRIVLIVAK